MKKSQRLAAVLLILLMLCGCSMPATPNTVVLPQTPAENHTESAPASAEPAQTTPETNAFHLEYEQTALPEPLSSVTALAMLEETLLLGGVSETGLALVRLTPEGRSEELPLPGSTEYLYALCPDGAGGAWLLCGSLPKGYFDAFGNFRFLSQEPEGKLALRYTGFFAEQQQIVRLDLQGQQPLVSLFAAERIVDFICLLQKRGIQRKEGGEIGICLQVRLIILQKFHSGLVRYNHNSPGTG